MKNIENKFEFYRKIKDEFQTPMTFVVNDMDEAVEINKTFDDIQFILKPIKGSGGYGVKLLDNKMNFDLNDGKFIMQEYVTGINLSSSLLATKSEAKTIMNSRLLTINDFEKNGSFIYVGNILPLTEKSIMANVNDIGKITEEMRATSENLAHKFNLIGSNGIDYILNEKGLYVIEMNPRLQGTYECVEKTLGINMLEAHIQACFGKIIDIKKPQCYSYKKIVYSPTRNIYGKIDLNNIYDLPHIGSITEKSEPLLTIIDCDKDFEKLCEKVDFASKIVNEAAKISQLDDK